MSMLMLVVFEIEDTEDPGDRRWLGECAPRFLLTSTPESTTTMILNRVISLLQCHGSKPEYTHDVRFIG